MLYKLACTHLQLAERAQLLLHHLVAGQQHMKLHAFLRQHKYGATCYSMPHASTSDKLWTNGTA